MRFTLAILVFLIGALPVMAQEEYRPVAISHCSGNHFSYQGDTAKISDHTYHPQNMIDGDPNTYGCLLDDTRNGQSGKTHPPKGNAPVTGYIVFDFGQSRTLYGLKLTAPKANGYTPCKVDITLLSDGCDPGLFSQYQKLLTNTKAEQVVRGYEFPYFNNGLSVIKTFKPTIARYLVLKVDSAYDSGKDHFFVYQFAEIVGLGDNKAPNAIDTKRIFINGETLANLFNIDRETEQRIQVPCTESRIHRDWIYQDHGLKHIECFSSDSSNEVEQKMVRKVLNELKEQKVEIGKWEKEYQSLLEHTVPGGDDRWPELYWSVCELRRNERLKSMAGFYHQYVYVKHYVVGGRWGGTLAMTAELTDSEMRDLPPDWRVGSELMLLSITPEGKLSQEVLLKTDKGIIRDPSVSFEGDKIAFAMKTNASEDYHLYIMEAATRQYRQITFGSATADYEPCFLQSGDLIFSSTRCDQSSPCWWSNVSNLYTCDGQGRFIRRLGFDTAHTFSPQVLDNGQVIYCRWEYNDRGPIFNEPLMVMNPDGTSQTEYYGNNSWCPTSIIHARGIPGTTKLIAIESGHHCDQIGKLMVIDRTQGTQEGKGLQYAAPTRPFHWEIDDRSGCHGELFQYPYGLDEDNYLVSYLPEGSSNPVEGGRAVRYHIPFGIYWMDSEGRRELLVYDPTISSGQIVPLAPREKNIVKASTVDLDKKDGTFFVQNVYIGPGLEGIPKGTVKKIRIVALEYRAASTTYSFNRFYGTVTVPVSVCNGSWDVKHVIGTVNVEEDGSAYFTVPARTPVYFQLLDEKGYVVQTMRSWAMVLPGENFGCVGCHEDKNTNYFTPDQKMSMAAAKPPQNPIPFYPRGEEPIPERLARMSVSERRAWEYLSVNAPQGMDRPRGFSYQREIQPIWDDHCVSCHNGSSVAEGKTIPLNLLGNAHPYTWKEVWLPEYTFPRSKQHLYPQTGQGMIPGRDFSESYLNLTRFGKQNDLVNAFLATSDPVMLKPRSYGSSVSKLVKYLEPDHYGVKLSQLEKDRVACWIDLCVPFCGSYMESNHWDKIRGKIMTHHTTELRGAYLYHEEKRLKHAEIEVAHLDMYKEYLKTKREFSLKDFPVFTFGGTKEEDTFIASIHQQRANAPIMGIGDKAKARGGISIDGNPRRNLAINAKASTFSVTSYPHASSNSHWKYLDSTSPKLVLDGLKNPSDLAWQPNKRTDLWLKIEFGRIVNVDEVLLTLKLTPGQKKTWKKAVLVFDQGECIPIDLTCTDKPQRFTFPVRATTAITLTQLQEDLPLSSNGIIEFEVWGRDQE